MARRRSFSVRTISIVCRSTLHHAKHHSCERSSSSRAACFSSVPACWSWSFFSFLPAPPHSWRGGSPDSPRALVPSRCHIDVVCNDRERYAREHRRQLFARGSSRLSAMSWREAARGRHSGDDVDSAQRRGLQPDGIERRLFGSGDDDRAGYQSGTLVQLHHDPARHVWSPGPCRRLLRRGKAFRKTSGRRLFAGRRCCLDHRSSNGSCTST